MEQTEIKIKLESDIANAQRDLKFTLSRLDSAKSEYNTVLSLKNNLDAQVEEMEKYLTQVTNDISNAKLEWVTLKETEKKELEEREQKAKEIIDAESKLDEKLKKIEATKEEVTEIKNENKREKLNLDTERKQIENAKQELTSKEQQIERHAKLLEENKQKFKDETASIVLAKLNEL